MADDAGVMISDLLPDPIEKLRTSVETHVNQEPGLLAKLSVGLLKSQADRQIRDVLRVDPFDLIAKAWATARELHAYGDPALHPVGQTEITYLGKHTLNVGLHPTLQISVGGYKLKPMLFGLILTVEFQAAALSIRDGAIIAVAPGDAAARAVLRYRDIDLHDPLPLKTIHLPAIKNFDPGLKIP